MSGPWSMRIRELPSGGQGHCSRGRRHPKAVSPRATEIPELPLPAGSY